MTSTQRWRCRTCLSETSLSIRGHIGAVVAVARFAVRRAVTEVIQSLYYDVSMDTAEPVAATTSLSRIYPHIKLVLERLGAVRRFEALPRIGTSDMGVWDQIDCVVERIARANPKADVCAVDLSMPELKGIHVVNVLVTGVLDEVRPFPVHIPERCRLVPVDELYRGEV